MRHRSDNLKNIASPLGSDFMNFVASQKTEGAETPVEKGAPALDDRQTFLKLMNLKGVRYTLLGALLLSLLVFGMNSRSSAVEESSRTPIIHQVNETELSVQPIGEGFSVFEKLFCRGHSKSWICSK